MHRYPLQCPVVNCQCYRGNVEDHYIFTASDGGDIHVCRAYLAAHPEAGYAYDGALGGHPTLFELVEALQDRWAPAKAQTDESYTETTARVLEDYDFARAKQQAHYTYKPSKDLWSVPGLMFLSREAIQEARLGKTLNA